MTIWLPELTPDGGPLYIQLADQIERASHDGSLPPGQRLPPQRNLAFDVGVTVGTVTRAYALLKERGLATGEVGRGTFLRDRTKDDHARQASCLTGAALPSVETSSPPQDTASKIQLDTTSAPPWIAAQRVADNIARAAQADMVGNADYVRRITSEWQRAGADWIASGGVTEPDHTNVLPVHGVQAGLSSIIAAMTVPGDRIACETLTYGAVPRTAQLTGRPVVGLPMDQHGLIPEALEACCAQQHPKALFLMPGLHNPTTITMPESRRLRIADIARRYNIWIIEDNLYGSLVRDTEPPFTELAPERTFHLNGLSKAVSAGLRTGWVLCPPGTIARLESAHKLMTGGKSHLLLAAGVTMVQNGDADAIRQDVQRELQTRNRMANEILDGFDVANHSYSPYLWLKLPDPWLSGAFRNAALEQGVVIEDEDEFKAGRGNTRVHGVRISLARPLNRDTLRSALNRLSALLDGGPSAYHTYS